MVENCHYLHFYPLLLLEVGKQNSQIIFAKILYLALSTRFGKYLNIPEIICKQKKTNKQIQKQK